MSRALVDGAPGLAGVPEMGEDRRPGKSDAAPASGDMDMTGAAPDELVMGTALCLEYQAVGESGPPHSSGGGCVVRVGSSGAVCAAARWFCAGAAIVAICIARRPAAWRRAGRAAVPPTAAMRRARRDARATGGVSAGSGCAVGRGSVRRLVSPPPVTVSRKKP